MRPPEKITLLSIIVPLYDEEEVLPALVLRLNAMRSSLGVDSEVIFVNDGSEDRTESLLNQAAALHPSLKVIHFTRNFGAPKALNAGMRLARGEAIVIMDGDLQDPPEIVPEMLERFLAGYDVVYGRRLTREGESFLKKLTSNLFCRLFRFSAQVNLPHDAGDFCLISRRVARHLTAVRSSDALLRGAISFLGFPTTHVDFYRPARHAGRTKFTVARMWGLAFDSVFAFSPRLLRLSLYAGITFFICGIGYSLHGIYHLLFESTPLLGWHVLVGVQCIVGGTLLAVLGITGEYVRRNFEMLKQRPDFVVRSSRNLSPELQIETTQNPYPLWERSL